MPDLREVDRLEVSGHAFERIVLEPFFDCWRCQYAIDGVKHELFHEPKENVAGLATEEEFLTYMKAQSLGMPVARE
jgi:hypothetical protein